MRRFAIVSSVRRGVLEVPELLGESDQAVASSRLAEDTSRDVRVHWRS